jgi:hypothetical protein
MVMGRLFLGAPRWPIRNPGGLQQLGQVKAKPLLMGRLFFGAKMANQEPGIAEEQAAAGLPAGMELTTRCAILLP